MGYRSHQTETCGLHVHISKASMGVWYTTVSKLVLLFWKHWDNLLIASRRYPLSAHHYAKNNIDKTLEEARGNWKQCIDSGVYPGDKYVAVNTNHPTSVEIRLFRGTLRLQSIIASIQLVDVLTDLAMSRGTTWAINSTWENITDAVKKTHYKELRSYLTDRHLMS